MGRKVIELSIVTLALVGLPGCPGGGQPQPVTGGGQEAPGPNVSGGITQEQIDEIEATRRGGMSAIVECFNDELERRQKTYDEDADMVGASASDTHYCGINRFAGAFLCERLGDPRP